MTLSCVKFDDIEFTEFERFDGAFRDIFVEDSKALSLELHESSFEAFHKVLEIIENIGEFLKGWGRVHVFYFIKNLSNLKQFLRIRTMTNLNILVIFSGCKCTLAPLCYVPAKHQKYLLIII